MSLELARGRYWLTPSCELIKLKVGEHHGEWAIEHHGATGDAAKAREQMYRRGWVRVAAKCGDLYVEGRPGASQARLLRDLAIFNELELIHDQFEKKRVPL